MLSRSLGSILYFPVGPSTTPAAGHARVADFITAPSHFIARTMRYGLCADLSGTLELQCCDFVVLSVRPPTGQPVIVMQPVLDGAMFAPKVNSTIEVAGLRLQEVGHRASEPLLVFGAFNSITCSKY